MYIRYIERPKYGRLRIIAKNPIAQTSYYLRKKCKTIAYTMGYQYYMPGHTQMLDLLVLMSGIVYHFYLVINPNLLSKEFKQSIIQRHNNDLVLQKFTDGNDKMLKVGSDHIDNMYGFCLEDMVDFPLQHSSPAIVRVNSMIHFYHQNLDM